MQEYRFSTVIIHELNVDQSIVCLDYFLHSISIVKHLEPVGWHTTLMCRVDV